MRKANDGNKQNLTLRTIKSLEPREVEWIVWDEKLPGFGLRISPGGSKSFILRYAIHRRQRVWTIGRLGDGMTPDEARTLAETARGNIHKGIDPQTQRDAQREGKTLATTWADYCEFRSRNAYRRREKWKPSVLRNYKMTFDNYVAKSLGDRQIASITPADIQDLRATITSDKFKPANKRKQHIPNKGREATANRVVAYLKGCFTWAIDQGRYFGANPTTGILGNKEEPRDRVLSDDEFNAFMTAVDAYEGSIYSKAALKLLCYTGCRRNEVLSLRWVDVKLDERRLILRGTKTGEGSLPLSEEAIEVLAGLPRIVGNPFVLPGEKEGAHLVNVTAAFTLVTEAAKIEGATVHDLRRTYGAQCLSAGIDIYALSKLLRHKSVQTTERAYAFMPKPVLLAAAEKASSRIRAVADGTHNKVVQFGGRS